MADANVAKKKKKGLKNFFSEIKSELKKVTWPTKSQLINNTLIILIFIAVVTAILAILDVAFFKLVGFVTNLV